MSTPSPNSHSPHSGSSTSNSGPIVATSSRSRKTNPVSAGTTAPGRRSDEGHVITRNAEQPGRLLGKSLDEQILQLLGTGFDEKTTRAKFLQMILAAPGVVGACFLERAYDQWRPALDKPSTGRLPPSSFFDATLSSKCQAMISSKGIQSVAIPDAAFDCLLGMAASDDQNPELLLTTVASNANQTEAAQTIQKILSGVRVWLQGRHTQDLDWQISSLSSIVELLTEVENYDHLRPASEHVVRTLASRLGCSSVAIGWIHKGKMKVRAVSGLSRMDHGSDTIGHYRQTMLESVTRNSPGFYPAKNVDGQFLLQAHRQLASLLQTECVASLPLENDGDAVGALVFSGTTGQLHSHRFARFTTTAGPVLASGLAAVQKSQRGTIARATRRVFEKTRSLYGLMVVGAIAAFACAMMMPVTYRVRCNSVIEPVTRRFAVAPFDGLIVSGKVKAGDAVREGQILAEMDGRQVRWELAGVSAELEQSLTTREVELAERDIPKTILAELEFSRLRSEKEVLNYRQQHLQIRSPLDGVVLSGTLERAEAASVEMGQVLFEVGPISPLRLEIAIPGDEVAQVQVGASVKAWMEGLETHPIEGEIRSIHPRSETRDAKNVFIAEVEFQNENQRFLPGMEGSVRIDGQERPLWWTLFHKPADFLRARLTWW